MIRKFEDSDIPLARAIHIANELPENCFPNLTIQAPSGKEEVNPIFVTKAIYEHEGKAALMSFLKITSEVYLLVDHAVGTPEERWEWLKELTDHVKQEAWKLGLEQISCWIPPEIEVSFTKRLHELGFVKSPWSCFTLNLES